MELIPSLYIALFVICCITAFFVIKSFRKRHQQSSSNSFICLYIPQSESIAFNPVEFIKAFQDKWGIKISCNQTDVQTALHDAYIISNHAHHIVFSINNQPLPQDFTKLLINPIYALNQKEIVELENHKANVTIQYQSGKSDPNERVLFTSQVLLTFFEQSNAIGCAIVAAQSYKTKDQLLVGNFLQKETLSLEDLFLLLVSIQQVDNEENIWLHTHGLEQFNLPNLEIITQDRENIRYYEMVIGNVAIYMMENENIFKPGDTAELMGDGVIFSISYRTDNEFPTGIVTLSKE